MHGNLDSRLSLKDGGRTVRASGLIRWTRIEAEVQTVRVYATVAQHEDTDCERCASGSGSQPCTRPADDADQQWGFDIAADDDKAFERGAARGAAVLISTNPGWVYPWGADCTLH